MGRVEREVMLKSGASALEMKLWKCAPLRASYSFDDVPPCTASDKKFHEHIVEILVDVEATYLINQSN